MSSLNSDNWMPFLPLPDSTSDDLLHTLQSSQFPPGSANGGVDPSFQIEAIAAFLDVLESDIPQDLAILDPTEANDQSERLIFSSSTNQQEAQNLVATTATQYDSSCSFNHFESMADVPMNTTDSLPSEVSSGVNAPDPQIAARKFRGKKCSASGVRSDDNESIFRNKVSAYRGVTRHKVSKRYEAHLWDSSVRIEGKTRKGRLVYLGGYNCEDDAAKAYDLAALKYFGTSAPLNFPLQNYEKELEEMKNMTKVDFVASLRRKSNCFARGSSVYRGVSRHRQTGRWQARIAKIGGHREDLFLGVFSTEEEAAEAYDIAAIKLRGVQTVTNFGVSQYDISYIVERVKIPITNVRAAKRVKESQVLEATGNGDETIAPSPSDLHGSSLVPTFEQPQPSPALQPQENPQVFHQNSTDNQNQFPYLFQESYQFNQNFTDTQNQSADSNFWLLTSSQEPTQFNQNFTGTKTQLPGHNPCHLNSIQESSQLKVTDAEMQLPDPIPSLLDFSEESDQFFLNSIDLQTWFPDTIPSPLNTHQESDQLHQNVTGNQTQLPDPTTSPLNVCQEADHFNQNSTDVQSWSPGTALSRFISFQESEQFNQNPTDSQSHLPQPTPFSQVRDQFNQDSIHVKNWLPDTPPPLHNSAQKSELNQSNFLDDMMKMGHPSPPTMENNRSTGSNYNEGYLNNGLLVDANSSLQMNSPAMESQSDLGLVMSDYNSFEDSFHEDSSFPRSPLWNDVTRI